MKVRIKNNSENKIPEYESKGAVGFDLMAKEDYIIGPGEMVTIDSGVAVEIPEGYMLMLASRSSTFRKLGLVLVNGVGIIDNDYCGDDDTQKFQYMNFTKETVVVNKGVRMGQAVFVKVMKAEFEAVETLGNDSRGAFGTTGL